jgi:hypothetical protein
MKRLVILLMVILLPFSMMVGCKSGKLVTNLDKDSIEVRLPFDSDKYQSDKKFIRSIGNGNSKDILTSADIAKTRARATISDEISILVENVTQYYVEQNGIDMEDNFERVTKQISEHILIDVKTISRTISLNEKTKIYSTWLVMELERNKIIDELKFALNKEGIETNNTKENDNDFANVVKNKMNKLTN